mmetsp:Transcript_10277/g.26593  ORF Transcript_10277/g.26593 Transcript_10277/m.26593 type:complete len:212 (-) Transcript_10277:234-869(-)
MGGANVVTTGLSVVTSMTAAIVTAAPGVVARGVGACVDKGSTAGPTVVVRATDAQELPSMMGPLWAPGGVSVTGAAVARAPSTSTPRTEGNSRSARVAPGIASTVVPISAQQGRKTPNPFGQQFWSERFGHPESTCALHSVTLSGSAAGVPSAAFVGTCSALRSSTSLQQGRNSPIASGQQETPSSCWHAECAVHKDKSDLDEVQHGKNSP